MRYRKKGRHKSERGRRRGRSKIKGRKEKGGKGERKQDRQGEE